MSQSARVESLDALKEFRADLVTFGVDAQEALAAADLEIQRTLDGLEQQLKLWQAELRRRQDELLRAKAQLSQKQWGAREPRAAGTTEAEMAVRKAQERVREAEAKIETVKRWLMHLPREIAEYQGPVRRLGGWLESELKQGVALLERRVASLEAYLTPAAPPAESPSPNEGTP